MVITDLGVFEFKTRGGPLSLIELAPGVLLDEIRAKTQAAFSVDLKS